MKSPVITRVTLLADPRESVLMGRAETIDWLATLGETAGSNELEYPSFPPFICQEQRKKR